jgi:hypothetical protein
MNTATSFFSLMPPACHPSTPRYTTQAWEERKSLVEKLYIEKALILKDVIASLNEAGFVVT